MYHPAAALHAPRLLATMLQDWEHRPGSVPHDFVVTEEMPPKDSLIGLDTETDNAGGIGQWSVAWRGQDGILYVKAFYGAKPDFPTLDYIVAEHNAKYDNRELAAHKMIPPLPTRNHCTMIQAYCKDLGKQAPKESGKTRSGSDMVGGLGLKFLARRHLGMVMTTWAEARENPEIVPEYNANDSIATFLLCETWLPTMPKHYFDIDMPLLPVLMAMEDKGVLIDPNFLQEFAKSLDNRLANFTFPVINGKELNPFSPQQLQEYVYGTLGLTPWKFTDGGQPSTDEEVLETIHDPVVEKILEYKQLYKDKGTYVDNYVKMRDIHNRVHPELKQTSTSTSRLSCARPNLQNVDKEGDMRKLIIAPEGHSLVRMDYNQLDFRSLAAVTLDELLMKSLNSGRKLHDVTAEGMNIKYDDAKTVNFGVMFEQKAWSLSQQLHITINAAQEFIDGYFKLYPGIKKYHISMEEIIRRDKRVTIPYTNRTRRIDAMYVEQRRIQNDGIREGINLPVQGLEAEVVKIGMIDLYYKHHLVPILQVHDELLFEVPKNEAIDFAHWLKDYVPTIVSFGGMDFPVEVSVGKTWFDCGLKENKIK
jgi:DNA polymerase-1